MWNNFLAESVKYLTSFDVKWNLPTFASANISHLRSKYFTAKLFHLPEGQISLKKRASLATCSFFLEAPPGFGPGIRVLQTRALPLGHGAIFRVLWYYSRMNVICQGLFEINFRKKVVTLCLQSVRRTLNDALRMHPKNLGTWFKRIGR